MNFYDAQVAESEWIDRMSLERKLLGVRASDKELFVYEISGKTNSDDPRWVTLRGGAREMYKLFDEFMDTAYPVTCRRMGTCIIPDWYYPGNDMGRHQKMKVGDKIAGDLIRDQIHAQRVERYQAEPLERL